MMESPLLSSTGSQGHCVSFSYCLHGLSADRLRVLLHPLNLDEDPEAPEFTKYCSCCSCPQLTLSPVVT